MSSRLNLTIRKELGATTARTADALAGILDEAELAVAKTRAAQGDAPSSRATAIRLARAAALGLPAAERHWVASRRCIVVVGDASRIGPSVR